MAGPVDEARAGVEYRERKRDGNAAGGHPRFFEEDADHWMIFAPHGSRPSAPPDARSGEPSTHAMVEVGGVLSAESKSEDAETDSASASSSFSSQPSAFKPPFGLRATRGSPGRGRGLRCHRLPAAEGEGDVHRLVAGAVAHVGHPL